jgi:hypothetical protein
MKPKQDHQGRLWVWVWVWGVRGAWKFAEIILSAKPHPFTEKQSTTVESDSAFILS